MITLLIVEDEENVLEPLTKYLEAESYKILSARSAAQANILLAQKPRLIILDWMLPDDHGIELLRKWRAQGCLIPVILLTARADLVDKVLGLELGASDYVTKPFEPRELLARIRAHLRTIAKEPTSEILSYRGVCLDLRSRESSLDGEPLVLTKTEFELLKILIENPNQVFSRNELLEKVWGYERFPTTRTVDTHILQLRQKIGTAMIETVHGIGYRVPSAQKFAKV